MRLDHLLSMETKLNEIGQFNIQGQIELGLSLFNFEGPLNKGNSPKYGGIAQLGEHLLCKQGVSGSIPLISTNGLRNTEHN